MEEDLLSAAEILSCSRAVALFGATDDASEARASQRINPL